ncbi:50S ribosomal protein L15 [Saccharolobus solfataricus]|uniref:Large ribosomal subunit protein uL15 n=3 Tax=Saccharolobus solfataricus TaxID=2287 RepID=RL15_SACS2|nr:uL15 family ribosomal protein [Saccharolobus solfataricus]Q9UX85.1 RecName: Full=Large ribosomal subunit protein uL15; AltName: Full=50S ribosomal protein L15 [Saccharolobus solfataricus P2]AAK40997.1 LSU ribosomal protein L15AB (rpl15AB) [Saccharolobus solfataricus P2]AKA74026.1 50S ribosomal protein L15 [Saccharolobus solfataricus]AKA76723.1 50S ribosomal protein L15 [Saccharolobus solfataricus]AKA79417.1 50S ribosomal protein L15 [Saccharolobus solfataricus]AZF68504.1 50S ribosomal prot
MVVRREKKSRKMRGSRTMGWGIRGQHRDRGSQGGRQIGMHKEKWSWLVKYGKGWYGKHGFRNPTTKLTSAISLRKLNELLESGYIKIKEMDGKKIVDLNELGYNKLLGGGSISIPVTIKVGKATNKAIQKVKEMGGEVILSPTE